MFKIVQKICEFFQIATSKRRHEHQPNANSDPSEHQPDNRSEQQRHNSDICNDSAKLFANHNRDGRHLDHHYHPNHATKCVFYFYFKANILRTTRTRNNNNGELADTLRQQRIVASPLQTPSVVSVSGLSPAQLQAATQRLIVSGAAAGQAKAVVSGTATVTGKTISPAQLQMIRQATLKQQQLRLQAGALGAQAVKTTTVTLTGQTALQVQFTQAQPRTQVFCGF